VMLVLCALTLTAALVLGGGTRVGFLSDVVLQLLSIPLLVAAVAAHVSLPRERRAWWVLAVAFGLVLIPLLQVISLPAGVWPYLANRSLVAEAYALSGAAPAAFPLSLTPRETWLAAVSLITPIGILLGTVLLSHDQRRSLTLVLIGVGMASVVLGLLQVAQGQASPLRFFDFTNPTEAVGFFANRNHLAALIFTLILFVGAWVSALSMAPAGRGRRNKTDSRWILYLVVGMTLMTVLLAAQAMARSRAGLGLTIVAMGGVFALSFFARRRGAGFGAGRAMIGAAIVAGIMILPFALGRVLEAFARDPLQDDRIKFARATIEAARSFMPWGSGTGSFVPVYQIFEQPSDMLVDTYVNRAHNDILEIWLETGVIGAALMAIFSTWLTVRGAQVWRRGDDAAQPIDILIARAAVIAAALIAAHSLFDYPLRTGALMAVMAVCCALLVPPVLAADGAAPALIKEARAKSTASQPLQPVSIAPAANAPASAAQAHGPPHPAGSSSAAWPADRAQPSGPSFGDAQEAASRHWQEQSMPSAASPSPSDSHLNVQAPSKSPPPLRQAQDQIAWPDAWTSPVLRDRSADKD
jgi:O-antigen ligase